MYYRAKLTKYVCFVFRICIKIESMKIHLNDSFFVFRDYKKKKKMFLVTTVHPILKIPMLKKCQLFKKDINTFSSFAKSPIKYLLDNMLSFFGINIGKCLTYKITFQKSVSVLCVYFGF